MTSYIGDRRSATAYRPHAKGSAFQSLRRIRRWVIQPGIVLTALAASASFALVAPPLAKPVRAAADGKSRPRAAAVATSALITVLQLDNVATGFAAIAGKDGSSCRCRISTAAPDRRPSSGSTASLKPYPDEAWNGWKRGDDPAGGVRPRQRVADRHEGPFPLDRRYRRAGHRQPDAAARAEDREESNWPRTRSSEDLSARQRHQRTAWSTTSASTGRSPTSPMPGSPGVIVLDLESPARRGASLDGDPSTTAQRPVTADDHVLRGPDGNPGQGPRRPAGGLAGRQASSSISRRAGRCRASPRGTSTIPS